MRIGWGSVLRAIVVAVLVVAGSAAGAVTIIAHGEHTSSVLTGGTGAKIPCIDPCLAVSDDARSDAASRIILALLSSATSSPINFAPVPLPASLPLLLAGLAGLGVIGWRRRKKR